MKKILDYLLTLCLIAGFLFTLYNMDKVTEFTAKLINPNPKVTILKPNEYSQGNDFLYTKKSKTFVPYSKQDIIDIFYSILDNGYDNFTFYCPSEYENCLKDIEAVTNNQTTITEIGNFVHPFNNFSNIEVSTNSLGEVNVMIKKTYTKEMIKKIDIEINRILETIITDDMDINDKLLKLHDYIIDETSYDEGELKNSGNAYGLLFEKKAKCAGYADTMAILLSRLNIKNYKVASEKHVWNALYLNDRWYQMDLTWDDPVIKNGSSIDNNLRHKFYMIDTPTLFSYDTKEHLFNELTYIELKEK